MTESGARDAVNGAALVLAGLYFYRKLIEPTVAGSGGASAPAAVAQPRTIPAAAGQIVGFGPLPSTQRFIVGFGFTFLILSLLEGASADLAGSLALLIAAGAILGNGVSVAEDIASQLRQKGNAPAPSSTSPTSTVQVAAWEPFGSRTASAPSTRPQTVTL